MIIFMGVVFTLTGVVLIAYTTERRRTIYEAGASYLLGFLSIVLGGFGALLAVSMRGGVL